MIDIDKLRQADRRSLGRAITLLESSREDHRKDAEFLLDQIMPFTGKALRIGITGVPGVGKSTFIDSLGRYLIEQGHKLAVLTVDPSSSVSGGSILGDKTRMSFLSTHDCAYIRPSPSGTTLGGVARRTREAILVCEAAGYDLVIVETVGVGQSETLVAEMTDIFLLLLLPGGGDELQGIKRGIMELADLVVVNKSDGDMERAAKVSIADVKHALNLLKPRLAKWQVPVLPASALHNQGIEEVWMAVMAYQKLIMDSGVLQSRRKQQSVDWLWRETGDILLDQLSKEEGLMSKLDDLRQQVRDEIIAPSVAARHLAQQFLESRKAS
ncbi:MAG: methylmalonyl Co-A mutase-associated GTPase MeaB [Arenicellales bacterium]